jgi:hypothetical protein
VPPSADGGSWTHYRAAVASDPSEASGPRDDVLEIDNPIERLKLLSGNDDEISRYLDAIEVTSPREREMLHEIARTRTLARPGDFAQAHRNMVEALESLARHGFHGSTAGRSAGPFRFVVRWGVQLVARYLVVSHIRDVSNRLRNLYGLREIESRPQTRERILLRRARMDAERMVDALSSREIGIPVFVIAGLGVPLLASLGRATGLLGSTLWGTVIGVVGMLVALAASWTIMRGAALASRRIRLATGGPARALWDTIGWCGQPPKGQTRTFLVVSVGLLLACWIMIPLLVAISVVT